MLNYHIGLCSGLTSHMISVNSPSNFISTFLSPISESFRYASGTSKVYTVMTLCVLIIRDANILLRFIFRDVAYFLDIYFSVAWCLRILFLWFCHISLLVMIFSSRILIIVSGSYMPDMVKFSSYIYYLSIAATSLQMYICNTFLALIWVNHKFTDLL